MTSTPTRSPADAPAGQPSRLLPWTGRIGGLALAGLGIAHILVNGSAFARDPGDSWHLFLVFGIGVGLLAVALAVVTWRYAVRGRGGLVARVLVGLAGILCCHTLITVLRLHPEVLFVPAGPGPWSLIAGPTLIVVTLLPRKTRSR